LLERLGERRGARVRGQEHADPREAGLLRLAREQRREHGSEASYERAAIHYSIT
jgi:hypothetical protein